jgi:hypothetical protein
VRRLPRRFPTPPHVIPYQSSIRFFERPWHKSGVGQANWDMAGPRPVLDHASRGVMLMTCKSCSSENQRRFDSEVLVHFSGMKNLNTPPVFVFPKLLVCLDCGFAEFAVPQSQLCLLDEGAKAPRIPSSPTQGWSFDLSEVAVGLPFSTVEVETRECAADKPLAQKNGFYRH